MTERPGEGRRAAVLTVSDRVSAGTASDESGPRLADLLTALGFEVTRATVPDDVDQIRDQLETALGDHDLVVATGGTGLAPRDVTPQALAGLLEYEIPGFGELMRAEGRRSTAMASLSRSLGGVARRRLVLALPGSPSGAIESLEAVIPLLGHALSTLAGEAGGHPRTATEEAGPWT